MFLGLVFRESAKDKRSLTSWRAESKAILPTHSVGSPPFLSSTYVDEKGRLSDEFPGGLKSEKAGYGFGRQGEKAAGLKGACRDYLIADRAILTPATFTLQASFSRDQKRHFPATPPSPLAIELSRSAPALRAAQAMVLTTQGSPVHLVTPLKLPLSWAGSDIQEQNCSLDIINHG